MESGLILANLCVRYPYAIPFAPKLPSVYGGVGLKCTKIGKNRP